MSTRRLKGHVGILVAGVVLAALAALAILAGLPDTAEAQEAEAQKEATGPTASVEAVQNTTTTTTTTTTEKGALAAWQPAPEPSTTRRLVVEPGDSLWSISEEQIGPGATPEQIAYEVEGIFELNRERIGENPNLISPGQEFFLVSPAPGGGAVAAPEQSVVSAPAMVSEERPAAANEESLSAAEQQQAPKPAVVELEGVSDSPAAEGAAAEEAVLPEGGVSEGAVSEDAVSEDAIPAAPPTSDQTDEQAQSTPAESAPATTAPGAEGLVGSVLETYNNLKVDRRLLGVGILALTLIVAILMAWRLPMRRNVEDPQAWGTPQQQYDENYAPAEAPPEEATREPSVSSSDASRSSPAATGAEEDVVTESSAVAGSTPGRKRLRRLRQRGSQSKW